MEIKRNIYSKLIKWKNESNGKSAILIEGARRIGKSTIAEKFAKENYKSYIIIDFAIASKNIKNNFLNNLNDLDLFFQEISLEYNKPLYRRNSLIIFDEVQKFPKARESIKYLVKDGRYDYLETGSLISIKENVDDIIIPSEEEKIKMYPITFDEFLVAANENILLEYIIDCYNKKIPLMEKIHAKAMRLFNEYLIVGGMPQSVNSYFESDKNFYEADIEKRKIINLYKDDINKASNKYKLKISTIFDNIPGFLSKHDKKIVLSQIDEKKIFDDYAEALFWLDDSMICNLCYKSNDPSVGLSLNKDESSIKCYMGDTGLLFSLAFSENEISKDNLFRQIISGKVSINKGMLFENIVAQILVSNGHKLFFYTEYSKEQHRNNIEIDFIITNDSKTKYKICPIEVKSSKNYSTTSYDLFKNKFLKKVGKSYIIHPKNFSFDDNGYAIPIYMTFLL